VQYKELDKCELENKIDLSLKEIEIMKYFIIHEKEVISRNKLLDDVWGFICECTFF